MKDPQKEKKRKRNTLRWCYWTVGVAYVDLAFLSVCLAVGIYCMIDQVVEYVDEGNPCCKTGLSAEDKQQLALVIFLTEVALAMLVSLIVLCIWATKRLLAAAKNHKTKMALDVAIGWRNVKLAGVVCTLVTPFCSCCANDIITDIATCGVAVWHAIGYYLACKLINELEPDDEDQKQEGNIIQA